VLNLVSLLESSERGSRSPVDYCTYDRTLTSCLCLHSQRFHDELRAVNPVTTIATALDPRTCSLAIFDSKRIDGEALSPRQNALWLVKDAAVEVRSCLSFYGIETPLLCFFVVNLCTISQSDGNYLVRTGGFPSQLGGRIWFEGGPRIHVI